MNGFHEENRLAYSTYSEAGGGGKTTTAANLAVAHARAGLNLQHLDEAEVHLEEWGYGMTFGRIAMVHAC